MSKSTLRIAIIILTLATAAIHLYLNFNQGSFQFQPGFTLNALGYLALMVLFFKWINLPFLQGSGKMIWYVYMGYTAVTVILYFLINIPGGTAFTNVVGLVDKVIEVLLIGALWLHKEQ
jgi:hypothetical protein